MPQFRYIVTVESTEPPNPAASDAMLTLLSEQGFVEVLDQADGRLQVTGSNPARADQLAFLLRDKLGEIWKSTTVLISEPQKQTEE